MRGLADKFGNALTSPHVMSGLHLLTGGSAPQAMQMMQAYQQQQAAQARAEEESKLRQARLGIDQANLDMARQKFAQQVKMDERMSGIAEPPKMQKVRVGDKEVTYQWDSRQNAWQKFGEGAAFAPPASTSVKVDARNIPAPEFGRVPEGYGMFPTEQGGWEMRRIPGSPEADAVETDIETADRILSQIDAVIEHPMRERATGMSAWADPRNYGPGSPSLDFYERQKQLQGAAFLEAFEKLKGGGQITVVEGDKATQAIARLNYNLNDNDYLQAINDLRDIVATSRKRIASNMARPEGTQPLAPSAAPAVLPPGAPPPDGDASLLKGMSLEDLKELRRRMGGAQ